MAYEKKGIAKMIKTCLDCKGVFNFRGNRKRCPVCADKHRLQRRQEYDKKRSEYFKKKASEYYYSHKEECAKRRKEYYSQSKEVLKIKQKDYWETIAPSETV